MGQDGDVAGSDERLRNRFEVAGILRGEETLEHFELFFCQRVTAGIGQLFKYLIERVLVAAGVVLLVQA